MDAEQRASDYRARLATEIRSALGEFNDENEPVVTLVRELAEKVRALTQPGEGWRVVPGGFVLVPVEPTPEMCKAGFMCESNGFVIERPQDAPALVYAAMLAAAPAPQQGEGE